MIVQIYIKFLFLLFIYIKFLLLNLLFESIYGKLK